jgi:hypothetical protein
VTLEQEPAAQAGRRRLSYGAFAAIVIAYLVLIQAGGLLVTNAAGIAGDRGFVSTHNVLITLWIPVGAALIFTYAVIAIIGWQRPVFRDDRPVERWSWLCLSCSRPGSSWPPTTAAWPARAWVSP